MIDNGSLTFRSMKQNELLAVPPNWLGYTDSSPKVFPKNSPSPGNAIISVQGVGRVGRFGLGDPNSDGTAAALIAAYNADAGLTICNDASGNGNATVLAFQQSYNGSTTGQKLDEDGKYGPNTQTEFRLRSVAPGDLAVRLLRIALTTQHRRLSWLPPRT